MDLLVIGNSDIAKRRIVPAAQSLKMNVQTVSRNNGSTEPYEEALRHASKETIVWISLINSEHEKWITRCLEMGRHTIVDKPSVLNIDSARRLAQQFKEAHLGFAEATVWPYHPQISSIKDALRDSHPSSIKINAMFSVPPFQRDNFRWQKEFGGGALWDLGPYAVSVGRVFFGSANNQTTTFALKDADEVDTSFSILTKWEDGGTLTGHFGFNTQYANQIEIISDTINIKLNRAFTTPPNFQNVMTLFEGTNTTERNIEASDPFANFLQKIKTDFNNESFDSWRNNLLQDAEQLHLLRKHAGAN